jgi:hypothetical protein
MKGRLLYFMLVNNAIIIGIFVFHWVSTGRVRFGGDQIIGFGPQFNAFDTFIFCAPFFISFIYLSKLAIFNQFPSKRPTLSLDDPKFLNK